MEAIKASKLHEHIKDTPVQNPQQNLKQNSTSKWLKQQNSTAGELKIWNMSIFSKDETKPSVISMSITDESTKPMTARYNLCWNNLDHLSFTG